MKEEGCFDDYGNRIAYTGANMIVLVQITRTLKETHKHIPDAVLLIALRFVFQIIDRGTSSHIRNALELSIITAPYLVIVSANSSEVVQTVLVL